MTNYEKFEKKLVNILNSSSNAKSWTDLLPIAKEILIHLKKNEKEIDFSKISTKHMLAKRLAQCLNPQLPAGLHEAVLETYEIILKDILLKNNNLLGENLGFYASGLFPFFQNASINNKIIYINKIIKGIFCKLEKEELE